MVDARAYFDTSEILPLYRNEVATAHADRTLATAAQTLGQPVHLLES